MMDWQEAQKRIIALAVPTPLVNVPLSESSRRYLSEDLKAKRTQPAADISAMDGYAVCYADLAKEIHIIGESAAGRPFTGILRPGQAVRVSTGAVIPTGTDTVIIQENAIITCDNILRFSNEVYQLNKHIRLAGSDFQADQIILPKGQLLTPGAIAAAAMAGYGRVPVHQIPTISIIASGDELVAPGIVTSDCQIPSSNSVMVSSLLSTLVCNVTDHGIVADNLNAIKHKIQLCSNSDVIVTAGGASVGDHDLIHRALLDLGADMAFWRVAIRPGKPIMAGILGRSVVIGLPGNPSSAFVTAVLFLLPLIRHLSGAADPLPHILNAICMQSLHANGDRTEFARAYVNSERIQAYSKQDSGLTTPLAMANALLIRPKNAPRSPANTYHDYIII
jgi:molybdopterin molybdotransferase